MNENQKVFTTEEAQNSEVDRGMQRVAINQLLFLGTHSWHNRLIKKIAMIRMEAVHSLETWVIINEEGSVHCHY